jgi:hypothetical protein
MDYIRTYLNTIEPISVCLWVDHIEVDYIEMDHIELDNKSCVNLIIAILRFAAAYCQFPDSALNWSAVRAPGSGV